MWLSAEYTQVVVAFEASQAGRDPKAAWRSHKPTVRQRYLALELAIMLQVEQPVLATKGQAHDWLKRAGGRFDILKPPPMPPLPRAERAEPDGGADRPARPRRGPERRG